MTAVFQECIIFEHYYAPSPAVVSVHLPTHYTRMIRSLPGSSVFIFMWPSISPPCVARQKQNCVAEKMATSVNLASSIDFSCVSRKL